MIDRLRMLLSRPVHELPRRVVFGACALVILLGALVLAQLSGHDHADPARTRGGQDVELPLHEVTNPPVVSHDYSPYDLPSEEGHNPAPITRADGEQVRRATRRFLEGYLPFIYGQAGPGRIVGATGELVARLGRERPRVPTQIRRRRPRIELVQQDGTGELRAAAIAMITDGVVSYPIRVRLRRTSPHVWIVTDVNPA